MDRKECHLLAEGGKFDFFAIEFIDQVDAVRTIKIKFAEFLARARSRSLLPVR